MRMRYQLGVNLHRQTRRRRLIRGATLTAAVMCTGLLALSATTVLNRRSASDQADISRRDNKTRISRQADRVTGNNKSQWLRVERAQTGTPSATPSQPVIVSPPTTPVGTTVPSPSSAPAQPAETTEPATVTEPSTPVASAPERESEQQAEVVTPAPLPEIIVTVLDKLPDIFVPAPAAVDLTDPDKKDVAMQLVSSAENSSLDWKGQYGYIEDIGDGRGYTGGIIGFTSGTHDMLELVRYYTKLKPSNPLAEYIPALEKVDGTDSHTGLGADFEAAWKKAATDKVFQQAQNDERDRSYFNPAVAQAKKDGLRTLGQFIYYDAMVMHGPGNDAESFGGIRAAALKKAKSPAQGGSESAYLHAFLDARVAAMKKEAAHEDVSRVETAQRVFLKAENYNLNTPLSWKVYGDSFKIQ